ncbi:MAG: CoA transferase, partial [Hoeflea sp.]|nr:CoA transferase [Hoeflea sp.]
PLQSASDPHMAARGVWRTVDGTLQAAQAPRFSTEPDKAPGGIPARGEHTDAVLAWLEADR